jgi:hypothetical protein
LHWTTKSILGDRAYAILGTANAPFYGAPARLRPIEVVDVTSDGVPDILLRTDEGVEVYHGETITTVNEQRVASPSASFKPKVALPPETIISHSGKSWTQTSGDAKPELWLSETLGGAPYTRVNNATHAYHMADGKVIFEGGFGSRYWAGKLEPSMTQNSSKAGSYVQIDGDATDPRFFPMPDFDGDGMDDFGVFAGHYLDWIGDEYWPGAIWFVSTKLMSKKLTKEPYLTSLVLPKEAEYSIPRLGGRTGVTGFARRHTSAAYGTTLVVGSTTEHKRGADHYSLRMLFHVFDLKKGLPKKPAAICKVFLERAVSLDPVVPSAHIEGVADFNGDGHLDLVLWEAAPESPGRAIVGYGPFCE